MEETMDFTDALNRRAFNLIRDAARMRGKAARLRLAAARAEREAAQLELRAGFLKAVVGSPARFVADETGVVVDTGFGLIPAIKIRPKKIGRGLTVDMGDLGPYLNKKLGGSLDWDVTADIAAAIYAAAKSKIDLMG